MIKLKISLILIVLAAISAGTCLWVQSISPPEDSVDPEENIYISKIKKEIEELKAKPDDQFCKDLYNQIEFNINQFYILNRFDEDTSQNASWKDILENNLYAAYTEKFINQAKYVFNGSEWYPEEIRFIQSQKNELNNSPLLFANSDVDLEFDIIQKTLDNYNEIVSFIESCRAFRYSDTVLKARFPTDSVQKQLSRVEILKQKKLYDPYVNNCSRLHDGLNKIPEAIFEAHIAYLENKINYWSEMYPNFKSHIDYHNNLYIPLKAEIESLDSNLYKVSNFDHEYNRLIQKWKDDNVKAYSHKYN